MRRRSSAVLLATLIVALASFAPAPVGAAADTWTFASSEHFEVYTTGGERRARSVLAYFERVHASCNCRRRSRCPRG